MSHHLRFLLLATVPLLANCAPNLRTCVFDEDAGVVLNLPADQCPDDEDRNPCYQDVDKDGVGDWDKPVLLAAGVSCGDAAAPFAIYQGAPEQQNECEVDDGYESESCFRLVSTGGDCEDDDDMNFPGNPEVCDGEDNNCSGTPSFDAEGESLSEGDDADDLHRFTCTPVPTLRIFLRGGGYINQQPLDGRSLEVPAYQGDALDTYIRLRILVPRGLESSVSGGAALTTVEGAEDGWYTFEELGLDFDTLRPDGDGRPDRFIDAVIELPDKLSVPEDSEAGSAGYLTLAGSILIPDPQDPKFFVDLDSEEVGSLTFPFYCFTGQGEGPPGDDDDGPPPPGDDDDSYWDDDDFVEECTPVWEYELEDNPDTPQDEGDAQDFNVADMTDLDLAACRTFGTAYMPVLVSAFPLPGELDFGICDLAAGDPCVPVTTAFPFGCNFVKAVVTER